jgi:hypothetical protein
MPPPPFAAMAIEPAPANIVAQRRAMLLALPLSDEPPTSEEDAMWEAIEDEVQAGARGHTTEEIHALLERMRRDQGE